MNNISIEGLIMNHNKPHSNLMATMFHSVTEVPKIVTLHTIQVPKFVNLNDYVEVPKFVNPSKSDVMIIAQQSPYNPVYQATADRSLWRFAKYRLINERILQ